MKHVTFLAGLLVAVSCQAESPAPTGSDVAAQGIAADLGTTAIGLSLGAAEANPLGPLLIPLKFLVKAEIDKMPDDNERRKAMANFSGMQFGAAAMNICTLAIGNPILAMVCFAGGAMYGHSKVMAIPTNGDCVDKHMAKMQEAAATGRVYKVTYKTCEGHFEPAPTYAQASLPASEAGAN